MHYNQQDNKRVAKNMIILYARMILLLGVSLYTSRVVLASLGVEDFGIYNAVGGIVAMFGFINMALANSTSRFITYSLGKGDLEDSKLIFSSVFVAHLIIAIIILLLSETIGLWFLYNKMVIPDSRMEAAVWVYQFSIISCIASILYTPYNATIIAHEKMSAFAYISIIDAVLKLLIAYVITVTSCDRLVLYAFFFLCISILNIIIYKSYCSRHFKEVKIIKVKNFSKLIEVLNFAGWSMVGNLAFVGYTQGLNILLNLFFGPVVNAARAIATQLQSAVVGFVTNFQMAVNPQITKAYAIQDYSRMHQLIYTSSKFSFFLLLIIVLPISIESKAILNLWLVEVPDYTVQFTIITLITKLIDTLSNPIGIANNATGNIKKYQIYEGGILMLIVPVSYFFLKSNYSPVSVFWVQLIIMYLVQIVRVRLVCQKIKMQIADYCKNVIYRIFPVALLSPIIPILLHFYLVPSFLSSLIVILISVLSVLILVYLLGLSLTEKKLVKDKVSFVMSKLVKSYQ